MYLLVLKDASNMPIETNLGEDITSIIQAINRGENVAIGTPNYAYGGWTLLHCAASAGNKNVLKMLMATTGDSIDTEAPETQHPSERTPRIILLNRHPAILNELEHDEEVNN